MSAPTFTFHVYQGAKRLSTHTLTQDVVKIGRLSSSHLRLDDESVARMHAVIETSGDDVRIIDLGAKTGLRVNDAPVEKHAALRSGDSLQIGPYRIEIAVQRAAEMAARHAGAVAVAAAAAPRVSVDTSAVEKDSGEAAEVIARLGDTVLHVSHVGARRKRGFAPWALGVGTAAILGGLGLFAYEVSQPWEEYGAQALEARETGMSAPVKPGLGTGALGLGVALLGLVPFVGGGLRMRDETPGSFVIGEGHDVTFPVAGRDAFALVEHGPGGLRLNVEDGARGYVQIAGDRRDLSSLSSSVSLPLGSSARVEHDGVTFDVRAVRPGAIVAGRGDIDWPFFGYVGGTGVIALSLWMLLRSIPGDMSSMAYEEEGGESRFARYMYQPDNTVDDEPIETNTPSETEEDVGGSGQRARGTEGQMGKPTSKNSDGRYALKGPRDAAKTMARDFDPDMQARSAGILGVMQMRSGSFLASPDGGAFAVGNDDEDVWGNITGTTVGEAYGVGGLGVIGTGRGGGGTGMNTVGLGNVGTIGHGGGGGPGSGYGRGSGHGKTTGFSTRKKRKPTARIAKGEIHGGGLDKDIIRRVVRSHINEVRSCYNAGIVRNPTISGRVKVNFAVGSSGKVSRAVVQENSLKDKQVGQCIAKAVRRWKFPKPRNGGTVLVTYPFMLTQS